MSTPDATARRLVTLEHAVGLIMTYVERQIEQPNPHNTVALLGALEHLRIVSWPEREAMRGMFARMVPGG